MSEDKCPKCGMERVEAYQLDENERWMNYRCGSRIDARGFVDYETGTCLRRQLAQANETLDKLPKTADGVRVVPGMTLWQPMSGKKVRLKAYMACELMPGGRRSLHQVLTPDFAMRYSTREAAASNPQEPG